ncbi:hypothetical protein [Pseudomonas sp. PDM20]|uniref:hypothetical protein n=1 Tax=Pseudomonas sp. PDM20 TaxID=2769254 RepID=UPI001785BDF6|nr:hypothetical protein [Pseudomonas sp. PDM20]MBD9685255.1 hypothetical protein [Pseudomonas sp. PDM20]
MSIALKTWVTNTTGDTWTDLAVGTATISSILINALGTDARVVLRLVLKGGATSYILPGNLLGANQPHRPAPGGLSLSAGDKLQCMSSAPVEWIASYTPDLAYTSAAGVSRDSNWSDLISGPAEVRTLLASVSGLGEAQLSIRLRKQSGATASIVTRETISGPSAKRLTSTVALCAGDKIQVFSDRYLEWVATGVSWVCTSARPTASRGAPARSSSCR